MATLTTEPEKRGVRVVLSTVWKFVKRAGYTFEKGRSSPASSRVRMSRKPGPAARKRHRLDAGRSIPTDETWLGIDGRSPLGHRPVVI